MIKRLVFCLLFILYTLSYATSEMTSVGPKITEEQKDATEEFMSQLVEAVRLADLMLDLEITETRSPDPENVGKFIKKYKIDYFSGNAQLVMKNNVEYVLQKNEEKKGSSISIYSKNIIGMVNLRIDEKGVIFVDLSFEKDGVPSPVQLEFINRQGIDVNLQWRIRGISVAINGAIDNEKNIIQVNASCEAEQWIDSYKSSESGVRLDSSDWSETICKYMMKKDKKTNISEAKYRFSSDKRTSKKAE